VKEMRFFAGELLALVRDANGAVVALSRGES
jgi:hypothetical protein